MNSHLIWSTVHAEQNNNMFVTPVQIQITEVIVEEF